MDPEERLLSPVPSVPIEHKPSPAPEVIDVSSFEDCLKSLTQFDTQLQSQQLQLQILYQNISKYLDKLRPGNAAAANIRGGKVSDSNSSLQYGNDLPYGVRSTRTAINMPEEDENVGNKSSDGLSVNMSKPSHHKLSQLSRKNSVIPMAQQSLDSQMEVTEEDKATPPLPKIPLQAESPASQKKVALQAKIIQAETTEGSQKFITMALRWLFVDPVYQDYGTSQGKQSAPKNTTAKDDESSGFCGINPFSRFYVIWEFLLSLAYICTLIEVPVVASFDKSTIKFQQLSIALTVIFGFAVVIKFLVPSNGQTISQHVVRYLLSSCLLDIVGAVPFDIILQDYVQFAETLTLLRLLNVRNLFAVFKSNPIYVSISLQLQKTFKVGSSFMSIFMLGGVLITFLHLHGCFIFLFGKFANFDSASWLAISDVLALNMSEQYIWAYFAAVANTFPITGYQPSDPFEQVFSIIAALVGAVLYAILVGTISSFSFGLDSSGRRYKEKIDEVHEYMTYRKLSEPIKVKVRQYYELKYKGKYFDEDAILNEMNESLKQEIAVHNCRDLIAKVPFLNREVGDGRDSHFLARIAKALRPVYFIKGDLIFDQGWVGNEMYFIQQGCVSIIVNGSRVGELRDGAFFGEVALLGEMPRTATIVAAGNTILYSFGRVDFSNILKDYEDMALRIKLVYEERMAKIQKEKDAKLKQEAEKSPKTVEIF
ncbi:hypothetical protein HDU84_009803 [Entophlyctis sp. JEL0112]|nr:hypothetical protein HDU84_009803 [Entophlyctis sp. JEL0112]